MRVSFLSTITGAVAIMLGFTGCEEGLGGTQDCYTCTLSTTGYSDQVCRADFNTAADFNQYLASQRSLGYTCN